MGEVDYLGCLLDSDKLSAETLDIALCAWKCYVHV